MSLIGWIDSERLQFIIDTTGKDVEVVPFPFKISSSVGTSSYDNAYIFDKLAVNSNSTGNRKKIMFTQVFNGEEVPLYCELDFWDHINRKALLWVQPKKYYNNNVNIFYLYFDKSKEDNVKYISEANILPVSLFMDCNLNGTYDSGGILPFDILKVNNIYKLWLRGYDGSKWRVLYSESIDFVNWTTPILSIDITHTYDAGGHGGGTVIYEEGVYRLWMSLLGADDKFVHCTSVDGITWLNFQVVMNAGATNYDTVDIIHPYVLKINNKYRMWYTGVNGGYGRILTCESLDGISWYGNTVVLNYTVVLNTVYLRVSNVVFEDGKYVMWFEADVSSAWVSYFCTSENGINWTNIKRFVKYGVEGTYDTSSTTIFKLLKDADCYNFFYGGYNAKWRVLNSKSSSLFGLRTPSQNIWSDDFISVHHFNNSYGYRDSTNNELHLVNTNNVQLTTSNLNNAAFSLQKDDSWLNFGNNSAYDFSKTLGVIIFGKFNAGSIIFNKGLYETMTLSYNVEGTPISYGDPFIGQDYTQPSSLLWKRIIPSYNYIYNNSYIYNNKLYMSAAAPSSGTIYPYYSSIFYIVGDFDIQVDFSSFTMVNNNGAYGTEFVVMSTSSKSAYIKAGTYYGMKFFSNVSSESEQTAVRINNYGAFRYVRIGSTLQCYYKDGGGVWTLLKTSSSFSTDPVSVRMCFYTAYAVSVYYSNFIINSCNSILDILDNLKDNSVNISSRLNLTTSTSVGVEDVLDDTWKTYSFYKTNTSGLDSGVCVPGVDEFNFSISSLASNTNSLLVGATNGSIKGDVSEVWFTNKAFKHSTMNFINTALNDNAVLISRYYVQGYLTEYNKAVNKKIAVYSSSTNQLLSMNYSKAVDGYYYCEVPYNTECFIVAFFGSKYNHFILGKIFPKQA